MSEPYASPMNQNTIQSFSKFYKTIQPWVVCLTASLFFMYEFAQIMMFNALGPSISQEFSLSASQFGSLSAQSLYGNVLLLPFAGLLLDRFSTRSIILFNMTFCVIATYLFATADNYWVACATRFIAGATGAFCLLAANLLASRWFPSNKLGLITGLIITSAFFGASLAQGPLNSIVETNGWRAGVMLAFYIGIAFTLWMALVIKDKPEHSNGETEISENNTLSIVDSITQTIQSKHSWLCGTYTSLSNIFIIVLGAAWGTPYLQKVHGLTSMEATSVTSLIFIGGIAGFPVFGAISDYLESRKKPMIAGAAASLVLVTLLAVSSDLPLTLLLFIFFTIGFTTSSQGLSYPSIIESTKPALIATCSSLASILIQGGGALYTSSFGQLIDLHANNPHTNNMSSYAESDFTFAFWMLPVAYAITLILACKISETYQKQN